MPQFGVPELLIIMVMIILIFGVGKLPQIGKALGQGIREFREASQGLANGVPLGPGPAGAAKPRSRRTRVVTAPWVPFSSA